jgi:hypothetical protein
MQFHEVALFDSKIAIQDGQNVEYKGKLTKVTLKNVEEQTRVIS